MKRIFSSSNLKSVLLVIGCSATLVLAASPAIEAPAPAQVGAAAGAAKLPSPAFEVAAIKPHPRDGSRNGGWGYTSDGFSATNLTLKTLVFYGYGLEMDDQLRGLPKWGSSDHWDIQARLDSKTTETWGKLDQQQRMVEMRSAIQNLLVTRFELRAHRETRELPIYDLVISPTGSKLAAVKTSAKRSGWNSGDGRISGTSMDAGTLAYSLSMCDDVGRIVVDKTGLTGKYDVKLKWAPEGKQETATSGPSIFTALKEQLGLKLVSARGPVDVVVVDHVEPPTPN